jgi:transposase
MFVPKRRGRPKGGHLSLAQQNTVCKIIEDRCPEQLKLPGFLWTREAVADLMHRKFGIRVSKWTVGRYLQAWGFTPQKPVRRAYEQNPEAVERWLTEDYPAIRALAKKEKAEIYWEDEMGMRSDHAAGRTYAPKGKTPVVMATGQRFSCNMISAITNKGHLLFMVYHRRFTSAVFLEFLKRMVRQVKTKIFLVADGHPTHRSRAVREWLEANSDRIRLFFLPAYSPQLNPDELLNNDVKTNAVGRRHASNRKELVQTVRKYLHKRQRQPHLVKRYFHEKHVRYAAE